MGQVRRRALIFAFLSLMAMPAFCAESVAASAPVRLTVIHTNDLHSHFRGTGPDGSFTPQVGDGDPVRGHVARVATVLRETASRTQILSSPLLSFDSGDAYCGTLFQLPGPATTTMALPEYRLFADLGYTALGLGNHEFEAGERGLAVMLGKAATFERVVPWVASNLVLGGSNHPLREHWNPQPESATAGRLVPYLVRELPLATGSLRVGVLGALGPDAAKLSLANRSDARFIGFDDETGKPDLPGLIRFLQERIDRLREQHNVQMVILLLHGGPPEDAELARELKGVDLILAGHTHETYVRVENGVWISQSGWRGEAVNVLDMCRGENGFEVVNPGTATIAIDDGVAADEGLLAIVEEYERQIDKIIEKSGFKSADEVCFMERERLRGRWPKNEAGTLVVDALKAGLNDRLDQPVHAYVSSYAMIRSDFLVPGGKPVRYRFSDVFRFSPLGHDASGRGGAPVTVFHLTPKEVHLVLEAMHWFSRNTPAYEPVVSSNLTYEVSAWGVPLVNRVHNLKLDGLPFEQWPTLIRVGANEFLTRNLLRIRSISGGMVDVSLRDHEGRPGTGFNVPGLPPEHEILAAQLRRQFPVAP